MSSANGIYGPENPFKDPKTNKRWIGAFDDSINDLLGTPKAGLTCPYGDKGRLEGIHRLLQEQQPQERIRAPAAARERQFGALKRG
ncbi:hypothetical protein F4823DRAFT_560048 [Ustulina deusta]|nr:hypothetical protein F4823DRAFT_560048 [Ustulina deusta]